MANTTRRLLAGFAPALLLWGGLPLCHASVAAPQGPLRPQVPGDGPTVAEIAEAAALFESSCVACHLPPDPEHGTDRAWLSQVRDTA